MEVLPDSLSVSRETTDRLEEFAALVKRWNPRINLISSKSVEDLWSRHIEDSAQLMLYSPQMLRSWLDIGSGGGFPGIVAAIMLKELQPSASVTLVEADQRKAVFLRTVARELGVPARIRRERIENLPPQNASVISARALAPLPRLLEYLAANLEPGGFALLLKGANAAQEIETALESWRFACDTYPSKTDDEAVVLKIGEIERV